MGIKVRKGTPADIPELVALGRAMHHESPRFSHVPYCEAKTANVTRGLMARGTVLVATYKGHIVGMLVGAIVEHFFSSAKYACDFVVYVRPEFRGGHAAVALLKEWDKLACGQVDESVLGISTEVEPDRTRKLYEHFGYEVSGYIMVKKYVRT